MANLEKRIADLESRRDTGASADEIVIQFIRPSDMACVAELHLDGGKWIETRDANEGGTNEPT